MLQIEYFAHRDRLLVTMAVFLCNGYHAGKYGMAPDVCAVKSLEITKKFKGTNGLDEYSPRGETMQALSKFCCQNKKCPDYGKRGANNLTVCSRFGKNSHIRPLYCRTCKRRFSERKGTPLFRMRLDEKKADGQRSIIQRSRQF